MEVNAALKMNSSNKIVVEIEIARNEYIFLSLLLTCILQLGFNNSGRGSAMLCPRTQSMSRVKIETNISWLPIHHPHYKSIWNPYTTRGKKPDKLSYLKL